MKHIAVVQWFSARGAATFKKSCGGCGWTLKRLRIAALEIRGWTSLYSNTNKVRLTLTILSREEMAFPSVKAFLLLMEGRFPLSMFFNNSLNRVK